MKLTLLTELISSSYKVDLQIHLDVCSSTVIFFYALSCRKNGPRLLQNNWSQRTSQLNTRGITNS